MHTLIVGAQGVGKSTLIRGVLDALNRSVWGYETIKEDGLALEKYGSPIYIYPAGHVHERREENLVGFCKNCHAQVFPEVFDRFAARLSKPLEDHIILLDEIGFMESRSEAFCTAIMALLNGTQPVIAAVKDKDTPFLQAVRSHPNGRCFFITEENRNALCTSAAEFVRAQFETSP